MVSLFSLLCQLLGETLFSKRKEGNNSFHKNIHEQE